MKKVRWVRLRRFFLLAVRVGLGVLFLLASIGKLRYPYDFLSSIYGYELVGPRVGVAVAVVLPWMELIVGVCLVGGILVRGALLICMGMGAVFVVAQIAALSKGLTISCGCFGSWDAGIVDFTTVIRTSVILLCAALGYVVAIAGPLQRPEGSG